LVGVAVADADSDAPEPSSSLSSLRSELFVLLLSSAAFLNGVGFKPANKGVVVFEDCSNMLNLLPSLFGADELVVTGVVLLAGAMGALRAPGTLVVVTLGSFVGAGVELVSSLLPGMGLLTRTVLRSLTFSSMFKLIFGCSTGAAALVNDGGDIFGFDSTVVDTTASLDARSGVGLAWAAFSSSFVSTSPGSFDFGALELAKLKSSAASSCSILDCGFLVDGRLTFARLGLSLFKCCS
jgi:hypothetical protein